MLRRHARHLCAKANAGVIASAWPRGLLQEKEGQRPTNVSLNLAVDLLFEVGWQSRHSLLDVRTADLFAAGRARGAHNVPYEPAATFKARASEMIEQIYLARPPAQHLSFATQPRGDADEEPDSPKFAKLIVMGDDESSLALTATAELLSSGYTNAVACEAGFAQWQQNGLPCELLEEDELPDSTF